MLSTEIRNSLKILVKLYYQYQDERSGMDSRLGIKKDSVKVIDENGNPVIGKDGSIKKVRVKRKNVPERDDTLLMEAFHIRDNVIAMEEALEKEIKKIVHKTDLWNAYLKDVKGVGEVLAAVIMTEFDINIAVTKSKMWQFCGLNPGMVNGAIWNKKKKKRVKTTTKVKGDKKTKGFLCPYNQFLKAKLIGVLGSSFLKSHAPYSEIYYNLHVPLDKRKKGIAGGRLDNSFKMTTEKPKEKPIIELMWKNTTENHRHKAAIRKMIKIFIGDLYIAWRTIENLPVRISYAEEYLGKVHSK